MLKSLLNKVSRFNFTKKKHQHSCFPVSIIKFLTLFRMCIFGAAHGWGRGGGGGQKGPPP